MSSRHSEPTTSSTSFQSHSKNARFSRSFLSGVRSKNVLGGAAARDCIARAERSAPAGAGALGSVSDRPGHRGGGRLGPAAGAGRPQRDGVRADRHAVEDERRDARLRRRAVDGARERGVGCAAEDDPRGALQRPRSRPLEHHRGGPVRVDTESQLCGRADIAHVVRGPDLKRVRAVGETVDAERPDAALPRASVEPALLHCGPDTLIEDGPARDQVRRRQRRCRPADRSSPSPAWCRSTRSTGPGCGRRCRPRRRRERRADRHGC